MDASAFTMMASSRTAAVGAQRRTYQDGAKMRQRDRRGVYQSIEVQNQRRSPEAQEEYELKKAEERLRIIEMISKYREDKIKAEFRKLEHDLKAQDQKNAVEKQRVKDKRNYYDKQKRKIMQQIATRGDSNDSAKRSKGRSPSEMTAQQ